MPAKAHMGAHRATAEVTDVCAERQHWLLQSTRRQICHETPLA